MKQGNIITLLDDPIPEEMIPKYPTYELIKANGGEMTYDIDEKCKFGDGNIIVPFQREAKRGEILRDQSMMLRVNCDANKIYRGDVIRKCREMPRNIELEMAYCASDIRYFANVYAWTFIPGQKPVPFILYPFQEDLVTWVLWLIKMHLTGVLDKSRKMGLSWLVQVITAYMMLFMDNQIVYHLSMTESEVDDRTEDSLLGKLRILLEELPEWMRGGWSDHGKDKNGEVIDKKMEIKFPETGGRTSGRLTGGQGGRGGRSNWNAYDEFPHIENAKETLDASVSLVDSKLFLGTVKGMNNEFARMRWKPGALVKSYHYTQHPLKDEKWAILERTDTIYDDERWAQEMDMEYETSTSGRVYPRFISKLKGGEDPEKKWVHLIQKENKYYEYLKFDPNYDVFVGLDFGISDPNAVVYFQIKPMIPEWPNPLKTIIVLIDEDLNYNQEDFELAAMLLRKAREEGYVYNKLIGDWRSAQRKNTDGRTLRMNLQDSGINVVGRRNSAMAPIKCVKHRIALPGAFAVLAEECPMVTESIQNWAFRVDRESGKPLSNQDPKHNQSFYSHINKALAYPIDYLEGAPIKRKRSNVRNWNTDNLRKESL